MVACLAGDILGRLQGCCNGEGVVAYMAGDILGRLQGCCSGDGVAVCLSDDILGRLQECCSVDGVAVCLADDLLGRLQGCYNGDGVIWSTTVRVLCCRMYVTSSCEVMPMTASKVQPPPVDVNCIYKKLTEH